jgi:conjugative transfer signal peptidase TraF
MTRHSNSASDIPLRIVGSALRRQARQRRLRLRRLGMMIMATGACLVPVTFPASPRLVWNASASAPIGLYWISTPDGLRRGDLVIARPPIAVRAFAARRRYLPLNVPLVKRIAAGPGIEICALGNRLFRDGAPLVVRRSTDAAGRPMPWWSGCVTLGTGRYLLVMTDVPASFDGRYFGPSGARDILGRATSLWTR